MSAIHPHSARTGPPVQILGVSGSLRTDSYNTVLLRAAARLAGPRAVFTVFDQNKEVPVFDEDLEGEPPAAVRALWAAVAAADAVVLATPEYNQSLPGPMKNLLDWISRGGTGLQGKPVAVIGASSGPWGTRIAQSQLRHVLIALGAIVMPTNTTYLANVGAVVSEGKVQDASVEERLAEMVASLELLARRLA
jgi:chromate reductase